MSENNTDESKVIEIPSSLTVGDLANKLDLVTREEFIVLKKIIEKQQKEINKLKKKKLKRY